MKHLKENNETYIKHLMFAGKIGLNLAITGILFLVHAVLPIYTLPQSLNIESTTKKLQKWNKYAANRVIK
jgi:hypothetical protein